MENSQADINSCDFKVEAYMKSIIKDYSLNKLLEKENELSKDIKSLDNDMQSLVYENYNKFINATDIVQNLKDNFSSMEDLLKNLAVNMEKISVANYQLSKDLKPKKERISDLVGINNILQKLQFLFDLPGHINDLINQNSYLEAVKEYTNAITISQKHKNLKAFTDIFKECHIIMYNLYEKLLDLTHHDVTMDSTKLYESFEILIALDNAGINGPITKDRPIDSKSDIKNNDRGIIFSTTHLNLNAQYMEIMDKRLRTDTERLVTLYVTTEESGSKEYMKFGDEACDGFLKNLAAYLTYYRLLFIPTQATSHINGPYGNMGNVVDKEDRERLLSISHDAFGDFLTRALGPYYEYSPKAGVSVLGISEGLVVRSLDKLCQRVRDLVESMNAAGPFVDLELANDQPSKYAPFDQRPPRRISTATSDIRRLTQRNGARNVPSLFHFNEMFMECFLLPTVRGRIAAHRDVCCHNFNKLLLNVKHKLIKTNPTTITSDGSNYLFDIIKNFSATLTENIKNTLTKLTCYVNPEDASFSSDPLFTEVFGKSYVYGEFLFPFYQHMADMLEKLQSKQCEELPAQGSAVGGDAPPSKDHNIPPLQSPLALLLFSRFALDLYTTTYDDLVSFAHQTFSKIGCRAEWDATRSINATLVSNETVPPYSSTLSNTPKTAASTMIPKTAFRDMATRLVNSYVLKQGFTVSQLIQKSVSTRDWLRTLEPRNARAAVKRVVEEITLTDVQVGQIYEEGSKKVHTTSNDSSRRTANTSSHYRHSQQSSLAGLSRGVSRAGGQHGSTFHSTNTTIQRANILSNHIYKLFSEKIVIYEPVELTKISIMTGIVKICLKTFLESIRLKTLGTFGFQQIQVDVNYLQLYLWRFVSNEKILQTLLDEILSTSALRCCNPVLMEQSVIDVICEK